jgi:hypothetical protein
VARGTDPICLFLDKPVWACEWDIYDLAGEEVKHLDFHQEKACWDHAGVSSGLYLVRVRASYQDGTAGDAIFKAVLLR